MQIHWTPIRRIVNEMADTRTFLLDRPDGFNWQEGARTHLGLPGFNAGDKPNRELVRHMSIATAANEGTIAITTRLPEPCSEFKRVLKSLGTGTRVALFKTRSHLPLERTGRTIYLLSQGVGLATFRAHAVAYLRDASQIRGLHALNVAHPGETLYADVFQPRPAQNFHARYVHQRHAFQAEARTLAQDADGLFYVVGSDAFLMQTTALLLAQGLTADQIRLDKHAHELPLFLGSAEPAAPVEAVSRAAA